MKSNCMSRKCKANLKKWKYCKKKKGKSHPNFKTYGSGSQNYLESMKRTRSDSVNLLYSFWLMTQA